MAKVVLLHSALGDSRLWHRQVEALAGDFQLVAPDLPGWGSSPLPTEPFSFVETVAALLPAALVGNSFGGTVALRTALAHPDRVKKLVLVGAGLPAWDWTEEMRDYFAAEEKAVEAGDLDGGDRAESRVLGRARAPRRGAAAAAPRARAADRPRGAGGALAEAAAALVASDADARRRRRGDKPDFLAIAEHLAEEIPDSDLVIVPGAGHLVGIDQPEELNALLHEFLA